VTVIRCRADPRSDKQPGERRREDGTIALGVWEKAAGVSVTHVFAVRRRRRHRQAAASEQATELKASRINEVRFMSHIIPYLWFENQAEEAANFYVSVFRNSRIDNISRYGEAGPGPEGSAMVVEFQLNGQNFMALNGMVPPGSKGQAPIALFVSCDTQDEVDALWDKLSAAGAKLRCGWLKDKYGIPWNIVPQGLGELLGSDDRDRAQRAMRTMLEMEKLDINELRRAYDGAAR
jgi:predicted 3-demethylubiquinone-9 3-methyltransferase (glyoxalase superfamily)